MDGKKPGVMVYFSLRPCVEQLSAEQAGELFKAILAYAESGTPPEFSTPELRVAWSFICPAIDADGEKYAARLRQASEAAQRRWKRTDANGCERMRTDTNYNSNINSNTNSNINNNSKEHIEKKAAKPPRATRFTPPSLDEVRGYCLERKNNVNAEQFVDFYSAKGWRVGNQTMRDWRAAVRTWERREQADGKMEKESKYDYSRDVDFFGR